jgi:hypothetical protein
MVNYCFDIPQFNVVTVEDQYNLVMTELLRVSLTDNIERLSHP